MTDKQLSCEGYEFNGPITTRNGKGGLMEGYRVRRLADNADLHLTFSSPTFRGRNVQVCKVKPADGWLDPEYHGCTFMAVNETSRPTTRTRLRVWAIRASGRSSGSGTAFLR